MKAAQQEIRVLKKRRQRRKKKRIINVNDPILFIAFKIFGIAVSKELKIFIIHDG